MAATNIPNILPDLEHLTPTFRFSKYIIPPKGSAMHPAGTTSYLTMARALRKKIMAPSFIDVTCEKLTTKRHTIAYDKDGFKMLIKLMGFILPHLGGKCLDVVDEISNIKINEGETLNSLYLQFTLLVRKLGLANHHIPTTSMIHK